MRPPRGVPQQLVGRARSTSSDDHPDQDRDRLPRTQPEWDGLAPDELRMVDDEDARVLGLGIERLPRTLEEQRIADNQVDGFLPEILALAPDRGHHEVTALCRHPPEDGLADERRARRDDDLGQARSRGRSRADPASGSDSAVLVNEGARVAAEVGRDRRGVRTGSSRSLTRTTMRTVAEQRGHADEGELEEPERLSRGSRVSRVGDQQVHVRAGQRQLGSGVRPEARAG